METDVDGQLALAYRRALEALRSGVPNQEAVKVLGCNQPQAENQFATLLRQCGDHQHPSASALGMLVSGGFGAGKSHLLSYLTRRYRRDLSAVGWPSAKKRPCMI